MYNKHVLVSHLTAFYMQSFRLSPPLISFAHGFEKPFILRGKKITCPGARDKLNFKQDKHIFSPNVLRTSNKYTDNLFFLD